MDSAWAWESGGGGGAEMVEVECLFRRGCGGGGWNRGSVKDCHGLCLADTGAGVSRLHGEEGGGGGHVGESRLQDTVYG